MTATAAVSRDATVSLRDLIAREPERTATRQRIDHLWQRTLCQPADDARFAIADLVNARHLERTGPSQWTATRPAERPAPPAQRPEPEEDTGDPTDDDGAADDPKAAFDDDPAESVRTPPVGHVTVTLNAGADPAQQVKVSGPRAQVDAVVRAYLRQRVAGKAAPLAPREVRVGKDMLEPRPRGERKRQRFADEADAQAPRVSAMAPTADLETVRAHARKAALERLRKVQYPTTTALAADLDDVRDKALAKGIEDLAAARALHRAGLADKARQVYDAIIRSPGTLDDLRGRKALAGMADNTLRGRVSELHTKGLIRRRDDGVWVAT